MPELWKATCDVCGQTFSYPDFECAKQPGFHSLPSKTYYHLGAGHIVNARERRLFAPMVVLRANTEVRDKVTGQIVHIEGLTIYFRESGIYETANVEEQFYLDRVVGSEIRVGNEGRDAWDKMYLTAEQQAMKSAARLEDIHRQIRESNILLDKAKTQKGVNADVR